MKKFLFGQCFILAVNATVSRDFFKKHEQVLKERRADLPLRRDEALRSPEKKVAFTAPLPGLYRGQTEEKWVRNSSHFFIVGRSREE